jgi:hypothetical protein
MGAPTRLGAVGLVLMALAVGCGSHHVAANGAHAVTKPTSTVPHNTSAATHEKPSTVGGPFTGTCPKVIAATCVPGTKYEGSGVCVRRRGNKAIARTLTPQDLLRLKKGSAKAEKEFRKTGKLPYGLTHPPTEVIIHMLPNGQFHGICEWGKNPALLTAESAGNY